MTNCTQKVLQFPAFKRRNMEANFHGGEITSDGGVLLLRQIDRHLGLSEAVARALSDPRRQASCAHDGLSPLRQRVYALALGYEDLNDHHALRRDAAIQTAVDCDQVLASSSTLCRWENRADRAAVVVVDVAHNMGPQYCVPDTCVPSCDPNHNDEQSLKWSNLLRVADAT